MRALQRLVGVGLLLSFSAAAATLDITGSTLTFTLAPTESGGMSANGSTITFTATAAITRTGTGAGFNSGTGFSGTLATAGVTSVVVNGGDIFTVGEIETPMSASLTVATPNAHLVRTLRTDGHDVRFTGTGAFVFGPNVTVARTYTIDTDAPGGTTAAGSITISQPNSDPSVGGDAATIVIDASADGGGAPGDVRVLGRIGGYINTGSTTVKGNAVRLGEVSVFSFLDVQSRTIELTGTLATVISQPSNSQLRVSPLDPGAPVTLGGTGTTGFQLSAAELNFMHAGTERWSSIFVGRMGGGDLTVSSSFTTNTQLYLSGAVVRTSGATITFSNPFPIAIVASNHVELGAITGASKLAFAADGVGETSTQTAAIVTPELEIYGSANARFTHASNAVGTLNAALMNQVSTLEFSQPGALAVTNASAGGSITLSSNGAITAVGVGGDSVSVTASAFTVATLSARTVGTVIVDAFSINRSVVGAGVAGQGAISIQPRTPGRAVSLGGAASASLLSVSSSDLAAFNPTLASVTIGGTGPMTIGGAITLNAPTTLIANTLTVSSDVNCQNPLTFRAATRVGSGNVAIAATLLTIDGALDLQKNTLNVVGALAFAPSSTLLSEIEGTNDLGRISLTGSIDLTNASLGLTGAFNQPIGSRVRLITNDGSDAVVGTFTGFPELADANFNGTRITYVDDGHNVSLIKFSSPTGISLQGNSIAEFEPVGTNIGVLVTDGSQGEPRTFSFVAGAGDTDNASFSIAVNQLASAAEFDFSDGATRSIRVASTDELGRSVQQVLIISIIDNLPPVFTATPKVSASASMPFKNQTIQFTAPNMDPEGDAVTVRWEYGDGVADDTGVHSFATAGTFTVKVIASDAYASSTAELTLTVREEAVELEAAEDEFPLANLPGCGCNSVDPLSALSLGLLALLRRRSRP